MQKKDFSYSIYFNFIVCFLLLSFLPFFSNAATYYSQSGGDPTNLARWNTMRAGGGSSPADFTNLGDDFVIQNTHTITTAASAWTLASGVNLQIESGGTLNPDNDNLTIGGTFVVDAGASYSDGNQNGTNTFIGQVTINGSWSTNYNFEARYIFRGGIVNNATSFSFGSATFNTSDQALSGTTTFLFTDNIIIDGITLTNNGSAEFTSTANDVINGANTWSWIQGANSTLTYAGNRLGAGGTETYDFTTNVNTVIYSDLGAAQTVLDANYHNLSFTGNANSTITQTADRTVNGTLNIGSTTQFRVDGAFTFSVLGASTVAGTLGPTNTSAVISLQSVDLSGGTLGISTTGTINVHGNLTFPTGDATLSRSNMTFANSVTVINGRTLTISNNNGVKTFEGLVTIDNGGTWTSTAKTAQANLIFQSGFTNNGTATLGGATFNTNNQVLGGNAAISFANIVNIADGVTVTSQNTSTVTIASTLNGLGGGAVWKNDNGTYLAYAGAAAPMATGSLDAATCTNNVNYNLAGAQNVKGTTYCNLIVSNGNTKTIITSDGVVSGTFEIASGTSFNPAGLNFTADGNCNIFGTYADGTVAGTTNLGDAAGDVIDLSGGTINGGAIGVVNINGTISLPTGDATIGRVGLTVETPVTIPNSRSITFNSNTGVKTFKDLVTVDNGGTWISSTITTAGNLIFQNGLTNNGTFTGAGATFNTIDQTVGGAAAITLTSVTVSGAITVTSQNTSTVTISTALNGSVAGSTWVNDNGTYLAYAGAAAPMATGSLDAATCTNSVNYNLAGAQNVKGTTYCNLIASNGNTKTIITSDGVVSGTFEIASGTSFNPAGLNFTANGNCNIFGTYADGTVAGTTNLGDAAGDVIDLSGGTINGGATGVVNINGTISLPTGDATIGTVGLTVETPVTIPNSRSITFNSNTGVKTFKDLVTVDNGGTWISSTITTAGNLIFQNGLTNNGTFTGAGATFNTIDQTVGGAAAITLTSVTVSGAITVTSQNTSTVTISTALNGSVAGSTWVNDNSTYLAYAGAAAPMATGALDASTCENTVNYNFAGAQAVEGTAYCNLICSNSGAKTLNAAMTLTGSLTVNSGVTLAVGAFNIGSPTSTVLETVGGGVGSTISGTGTLTLGGNIAVEYTGAGAITTGATISCPLALTNATTRTITVNDDGTTTNQDLIISGIISTTGTLEKAGAGALTLSGANSYSGGTNLSAGALFFGNNSAIGTGTFTINSGTSINATGVVVNSNNNLQTWNGNFTFNGSNALDLGTGDITMGSNVILTATASTLTVGGINNNPTLNLTKAGAGVLAFGSNLVSLNDLTISAGALNSTSGNLIISEDFNNGSTFNHNNGTVIFAGTINANMIIGQTTFEDVIVSNTYVVSPQVTLSGDIEIDGSITFSIGIVNATTYSLTINSGATTDDGNNTSFFDGPIIWKNLNGAGPFTFPTGDGERWARCAVSDINSATDFIAQYIDAPYVNVVDMAIPPSSTGQLAELNNVSTKEHWNISRGAVGVGDARITLHWESGWYSRINNCADLRVAHWTGADWENIGGTIAGGSNCQMEVQGLAGPGSITSDIVLSFSPFNFGSESAGVNPLPIELLSFTAIFNGKEVDLKWVTATEINNDFFTIERSKDGVNFQEVAIVPSKSLNGNSTISISYFFQDHLNMSGEYYYRLKQSDFDGKFSYSKVVAVKIKSNSLLEFNLFPNPNNGKEINLSIKAPTEKVLLIVSDVLGQQFYKQDIIIHNNENNNVITFETKEKLPLGVYLFTIYSEYGTITTRVVVH
jgi:autotransporter-associated beta strand protein